MGGRKGKGRKECIGRQGRRQSNMPAHRDRAGTGRQGTVKHASTTCVTYNLECQHMSYIM